MILVCVVCHILASHIAFTPECGSHLLSMNVVASLCDFGVCHVRHCG